MPTKAKSEPKSYIATDSGSVEINGRSFGFTAGVTIVNDIGEGKALLKAAAAYFKPVGQMAHYGRVEQATAAPGETRA